jgi:hypothetical protein
VTIPIDYIEGYYERGVENERLRTLNAELIAALRDLADDTREVAEGSFHIDGVPIEESWAAEDAEGYRMWCAARDALAKAESP